MPKVTSGLITCLVFLLLFVSYHPAYAQGLRTEELGNTEKQEIADLARKMRDNPNDGDIAFASSLKLIEINHVAPFNRLKDLYDKGSEIVKAKIVKAIGQRRDKGVIKAANEYWQILSQALDSASAVISDEVVKSLGRLESEEFFDKLLEKLKAKESSKTVIDNVVKVLCKFADSSSEKLIQSTKTLDARVAAVKLLAARGDASNEECLLRALEEEFAKSFSKIEELDKWWQENRKKSIAQIYKEANRRQRAQRKKVEERERDAIRKQVKAEIENLKTILAADKKKATAKFLAKLGDPEARPEVLVFSMEALGRLEAKDAFAPIMRYVQSGNVQVRIAAIKALSKIDHSKALPEIAKRVFASILSERLAAINAIPSPGSEQAAQVLLNALGVEKDHSARRAIVRGFGQVGLPDTIVPLVEMVAVLAEGKLDKIRDAVANDLLMDVADALGQVLIKSGSKCRDADRELAIDLMVKMLGVDNEQVKYAAIKNLGNVGAEKAIGNLVEVLNKNSNPGIRKEAARAIGHMPRVDDAAIQVLYAGLKGKEGEVAQACMWALRSISGLNGSDRRVDLQMLGNLSLKLRSDKDHKDIRLLLKNLPEEKDLKPADKNSRDKLYELRGVLAEAHEEVGDFKAALAELEKVVPYFPDSAEYRESLAQVYAALDQVTKAIDEYSRLITVNPQQALKYWQEKVKLIEKISDDREKAKMIEKTLQLNPPQEIRQKLERMKQGLSPKPPQEPGKTP